MTPDQVDLTALLSDESQASLLAHQNLTPHKPVSAQSQPPSQPGSHSRSRRPISPPALSRQTSASAQGEAGPMAPAALPRSNQASAQKPPRADGRAAVLPVRTNMGSAVRNSQGITSPAQSTLHSAHRTPKLHHTPRKADWTADKVENQLRIFSRDIGKDSANLSARLLRTSWKRVAPEANHASRKNWFAEMKRVPPEASKGTVKIKLKHMGPGRTGKQEKRELYEVVGIKTDRDPVPRYGFHHVEISKNILSPNTMLNFVPHLRDLADEEEPKYRRWLENLESMDKTSGFATLSRQEKVHKTCQKERATTLLLYLQHWLDSMSIENCSKATLIRYMANQTDAVTPQQKSSILNSYSDEAGSPRSAKAVRMFTDAFDSVFNDADTWKEGAVTLRDVLLLDKSVDTIVDTKKWMKDTPSQVKPVEENTTVESFLETYALLGCLICCSHSCEHGEYGVDNERKRFSIEVIGGLEPLLRRKAVQGPASTNGDGIRKSHKPCGEDCYLNGRPGTRAKAWSETEIMLLKSLLATLSDTEIPVQCSTAVATGRPCWDVNRQLDKLDLSLPVSSPQAPVKVKPVHWYDRNKKMLLGDWQDQTITHEHQRKDHFDPCNHEGPCTRDNCECFRNGVMCERFCRCTPATCAIKFTGCACHSQGKTCLPKQKGERPCICVQLNRECDPALCGSCGAKDRANPVNAEDDNLYTHGCQNCALQRGKPKSLVLGKSTIANCGYGLFAAEDIAQEDFVIEYVGELISQDEGVRREARRGDVFNEESNSSYLFTLLEQEGIWVDAAIYGNLSRYINHQDDGGKGQGCNITPKILYVGGEYRIKFSAVRDIKAGDELFFNYGENFPNLTKKLLDEQHEDEKSKKRRAKEKNGNDAAKKPRGPRGPYKGKKRGRKPKKKAFAARIESDPEDDDDVTGEHAELEDPFPDIVFPKSRKRKHVSLETDSEEEEYRPEIVDSDAPSIAPARPTSRGKPRGRKRLDQGSAMRKTSGRNGLFGRALKNRLEDVGSDGTNPEDTPRRRGRKAHKIDDDSDEPIDDVIDAEYRESQGLLGHGRRSGGSARRTRGPADNGSVVDEDTPSRTRARRRMTRDAPDSSPLSAPDPAFDNVDFDAVALELNPPAPPVVAPPKKKRGRPRKVVVQEVVREEIQETDGYGEENSVGGSARSNNRSDFMINDSDASSTVAIDRSRVRKKPARYDD
ncbi:hypothetical protein JX266_009223 [Neoarthrinium moseri]|nr:hypothetical protein JX266_009223 [Neoarthrinium moseri]